MLILTVSHLDACRNTPGGLTYPELVLAVLGPLVERPVVVEAAHVVDAVEALDPLGHALKLRHVRDV